MLDLSFWTPGQTAGESDQMKLIHNNSDLLPAQILIYSCEKAFL